MKLPRFRIEDTTDLMRDLTSLGVNHVATSGEADLGNMVSRNLVHLSQFTQKYENIEIFNPSRQGPSNASQFRGAFPARTFRVHPKSL